MNKVQSTEPNLADYMAKWAAVNIRPCNQEDEARREHAQDLIAWQRQRIAELCRLLPEEPGVVPIKLMIEKINELAEDMYLSGVTTFEEDQQLQAVFDALNQRYGINDE